VYISKQIDNWWIQVGLNRDEVNQIIRSRPYNPQATCPYLKDEWDNADEVNANKNPCCPTVVTGLSKRYHCQYNPQAEREKVLDKFADLIHNESVRLSPAMVDMVYSYRVAQIITELRQEGKDGE
jgi:hypothetical protein